MGSNFNKEYTTVVGGGSGWRDITGNAPATHLLSKDLVCVKVKDNRLQEEVVFAPTVTEVTPRCQGQEPARSGARPPNLRTHDSKPPGSVKPQTQFKITLICVHFSILSILTIPKYLWFNRCCGWADGVVVVIAEVFTDPDRTLQTRGVPWGLYMGVCVY